MAKLTRTEKYKDLRESLAHDVGQEIESKELERFQSRLNRLDAANFEAPKPSASRAENHDPIHARRSAYGSAQPEQENTQNLEFNLGQDRYQDLYQTDSFSNDYLDRYINEVKQYNIEQGNAVSENTSVNILNRLRQDQESAKPSRPYREEPARSGGYRRPDTAEVPFAGSVQPSRLSARDIASEVQNLADDVQMPAESTEQPEIPVQKKARMDTDEFSRHLEMERTTRQQLLNETTQMRAKLDDYEDNLSEVSDKMRHTNQILNIVLIVLIAALVIVLGVVIYWIVLSNGGR